ncbi:MAG TPA: hypothetical protein DGG94_22770 [Micromonosporaceae bacterium]|nr:hypothetical protein [Micromonosporaceae bacterium]HCU52579.1 hypothetical protein [Micromonosporaceae bacterium]
MTISISSRAWAIAGFVSLLLVGGALLYTPFHHFRHLDAWEKELRERGKPAQALVFNRVTKPGGNRSSDKTTMYFQYDLDGVRTEAEVGCVQVCLYAGTTVAIWVNPDDPTDFVTEFDQLSGHRGRFQGVLGAAGAVLLFLTPVIALSRRRASRRRLAPKKR